MNKTPEGLFKERESRILAAVKCESVTKIPCIYMGTAFSPKYMGVSMKDFCLDADLAMNVTIDTLKRLGDSVDGINLAAFGHTTMVLTTIWNSRLMTPGLELGEDDLWQVAEKEVMTLEDYDFIIENGYQAFAMRMIPKVCDHMDLMQEAMAWLQENLSKVHGKYKAAGFPAMAIGLTSIPFEALCGARSMNRFFFDLYRHPEKVEQALDISLPFFIEMAKMNVKQTGAPGIWVGGWRSASAMLAPDLWERFVWPHLKKLTFALIEEGIIPIFHLDQNWDRDIEKFLEFPAKSCVLNLDGMTDIRNTKKILDGHTAIMGDVPSALFSTGTPEEIREYVKSLVQDVGPQGLLLCPGCDAPTNAKPENMEAFVAACDEFGRL